jgi:hypothetical protein
MNTQYNTQGVAIIGSILVAVVAVVDAYRSFKRAFEGFFSQDSD